MPDPSIETRSTPDRIVVSAAQSINGVSSVASNIGSLNEPNDFSLLLRSSDNSDNLGQHQPVNLGTRGEMAVDIHSINDAYEAPRCETPKLGLLDLRTLSYANPVDDNLLCPICHAALSDPVDTECGHTFCSQCIDQSMSLSPICPYDRNPISRDIPLRKSHRLIINQLDALIAICPHCEAQVPRPLVQNHIDRLCREAPVKCPDDKCELPVKRKFADHNCLHYKVTCDDCNEEVLASNIDQHSKKECREKETSCTNCHCIVLRHNLAGHLEDCPAISIPCQWAEYGCRHVSLRSDMHLHMDECTLNALGLVATMMKKETSDLRREIRSLSEKDRLQERRIRFLENGRNDFSQPPDFVDIPSSTLPPASEPLDSTNEYLLSLLEAQAAKVDQMSVALTELEARQTMMLFNETLPIKTDLAELRSTQQVISMHVRWLLNFRRQENQRRLGTFGATTGDSESGGGNGIGNDLPKL